MSYRSLFVRDFNNDDKRFFCVLCWRRVIDDDRKVGKSKYFCDIHVRVGENKKVNLRAQRKIIKRLKKLNPDFIKIHDDYRNRMLSTSGFYDSLSAGLLTLTKSPVKQLEYVTINDYSVNKTVKSMMSVINDKYPISYEKLSSVKDTHFNSAKLVVLSIVKLLGAENEQLKQWSKNTFSETVARLPSGKIWVLQILTIIARYEAYEKSIKYCEKRGPKATELSDNVLDTAILSRVKVYKAKGVKVTNRQIGDEVGCSGAWVGRVVKKRKGNVM